jgi:hypothetical protein
MGKLLELLKKFVRAIFGPGDKQDTGEATPAPAVPEAEAVTGWEGDPPYRYIDVSRYQGKITLDGWRKVKAAGYKGAMLKTVSTNRKLSKRADGLYIDPTFETNYRNARAAGLDVGVYYYTYATSEAMADAELALLRQALRGKELTLPVAVDVEDNRLGNLDKQSLTDLTAYALHEVAEFAANSAASFAVDATVAAASAFSFAMSAPATSLRVLRVSAFIGVPSTTGSSLRIKVMISDVPSDFFIVQRPGYFAFRSTKCIIGFTSAYCI